MTQPVVRAATQVLAHVPGMARHGSKPTRELPGNPEVESRFLASLRSFEDAVGYAPHQAYLGTIHPREMPPRPWPGARLEGARRFGPDGELMPEAEFLGLMAAVDEFNLMVLDEGLATEAAAALSGHPLAERLDLERIGAVAGDAEAAAAEPGAQPLFLGAHRLVGAIKRAHEQDDALVAHVLHENLSCKATATLALVRLLHDHDIDPDSIDYVICCSEEAVGDRYQRGGGNMAKAVAVAAGLSQASGADLKNFCAAPIPATVVAASLVSSGVFRRVAVVAGGSLAKLGMKFQGHLKNDLPVLEDVLGGAACLVEADGTGAPRLRLDTVGRHRVAAGSSNPQIMESLAIEPLARNGMTMLDIDDYATELHDPEVTEPQGSGNVPDRNYRIIGALAIRRGDITREGLEEFVTRRGMPGFAPTQGHLASALCYLPHALRRLGSGEARRVQLIAKGSLFLGRMTQQSDGMSVVLEQDG